MRTENRKYIIRKALPSELEPKLHYYHMPLLIEYKGKKQILSAGYNDTISVFRKGDDFVILSTNYNLDYAGLQIVDFEFVKKECFGNIFFQSTGELEEYLQKSFWSYSKNKQADILMQYLYNF